EVLQVLVMKTVSELSPLGGQIPAILALRRNLDRHLLHDGEAEAVDAGQLLRVVREDADRREAEVGEDLVADPVVARIGWEAGVGVRLDGVRTLLLQLVGAQLVEQADAAALLGHVEQHAAPLLLDLREGLLELLAAVAAERVEDVAGEALRVDA